jgi:hypothetical protein
MLKIPNKPDLFGEWCKDVTDECMASSDERGLVLTRAAQYYYSGSYNTNAAIYNKTRAFIDRLAGFLMQPTDVRFAIIFDSSEPEDVLKRGESVAEKLTADYKSTDSDVTFSEANTWALVNGCQLLKHLPHDETFKIAPVHPQNFGVLSETTLDLDEQEAFVHVSYPTTSRLRSMLEEMEHPKTNAIMAQILEGPARAEQQEKPTYFHQMVVGGLHPVGEAGSQPSAAGIVNVFPVPTPWRPNTRLLRTVKHCELWVKNSNNDYTTIQFVDGAEPIIIEGDVTRRNLSRIPGHHPFVKLQAQTTPGYFWGRSLIADVQMLQDILSKRLRDLKIMWDRNVNAAQVFSGFTSVTPEEYFKIINEGGFISDPNPNAKANKLVEPPPENYLEELDFLFKLFDEAAGFSPIMGGQGEPGVRAGVHAQTLVRTSSPRLIDQAARLERQLAQSGYLCMRIMQAMDPSIYTTDSGAEFTLAQLPFNFQVEVDSHSASPAFAEDNRQVAIALARAGAIDAEDLIHMLHPPGTQLLLARLKQRQKAQAQQAKEQKTEELFRDVLRMPQAGHGIRRSGRK